MIGLTVVTLTAHLLAINPVLVFPLRSSISSQRSLGFYMGYAQMINIIPPTKANSINLILNTDSSNLLFLTAVLGSYNSSTAETLFWIFCPSTSAI